MELSSLLNHAYTDEIPAQLACRAPVEEEITSTTMMIARRRNELLFKLAVPQTLQTLEERFAFALSTEIFKPISKANPLPSYSTPV